jgi:hypothetical protein
MLILRAFLALLAGFASMAAIVGVSTALLIKLAPQWVSTSGQPRTGYIVVNLSYSLVAAIIGGYITASAAENSPLVHVLALALIVLLMAALSALQQRGQQPIWYQLLLAATMPLGVLLGGVLRLKFM